jgi:signal transduction histidine kinase
MSHEIRNPLTTIQAVCGSLILETEDSEQLHRLYMISKQVDQLSSLLNTELDLDERSTTIDLGDLSGSLVNLLQYQAREDLKIHLYLPSDPHCMLSIRALSRSLYHLLDKMQYRRRADTRTVRSIWTDGWKGCEWIRIGNKAPLTEHSLH